jgi:bacterioferritin (cytochrome b1)
MPDEVYSYPGERPDPRTLQTNTSHLWDSNKKSLQGSKSLEAIQIDEDLDSTKIANPFAVDSGDIKLIEAQIKALLELVETSQQKKDLVFEQKLTNLLELVEKTMNGMDNFSQRLVTALNGLPQPVAPYSHPPMAAQTNPNVGIGNYPDPRFSFSGLTKPEEPHEAEEPVLWAALLNQAARLELAGVLLYRFYSGLLAEPQYVELFQESSNESFTHYDRVQELILSLGLKEYLVLKPDLQMMEIEPIPRTLKDLAPSVFTRMAIHEQKAIEAYKDLGSAVSGKHWALENFSLTMVEEETRHYLQLAKLAGMI